MVTTTRRRSEATAFTRALAGLARAINSTLDDAAAHARNVLTDAIDSTREGRPTASAVKRSRSYHAALARLSELGTALQGGIEAFRVESYREAWPFWVRFMPPEVLRPGLTEHAAHAAVERCRVALIHGRTLSQDLRFAIDRIAKGLAPVLTVAGNRATTGQDASLLIRRWAEGAKTTLQTRVRALLVDSQTIADRLAGRDVCRPEALHPDPSLPA